ncbi:hypothetical protein EVAR_38284_1 [Eumeta japonica]|uniref:Uncharacterized protein n=1 Tax=Eumeta variegata TaxID=151549 RepID=A0A4C1W9I3_EUMVA|nr:hypothetical protein EVAR_38284_1 [Eumeta japonica]
MLLMRRSPGPSQRLMPARAAGNSCGRPDDDYQLVAPVAVWTVRLPIENRFSEIVENSTKRQLHQILHRRSVQSSFGLRSEQSRCSAP